jgi:hypothetical protein
VETDCTGDFFWEKAIEKTILRVLGSSEFSHRLGRNRTALPRGERLHDQVHRLQQRPAEIPGQPPSDASIFPETDHIDIDSDEAPSVPAVERASVLTSSDVSPIAERYPLLRNAL